mmetsp:Transcript_1424/g.4901  ORF Transcript_1424/g.4901 Transcript_1424/m.4901 type:complete len:257 (+) Transcript_1424:124-894(+)
MMVCRRWATMSSVASLNSLRIVDWMSASVSMSTLAVASSSTSSFVRWRMARARHSSWRWPTLQLLPPSDTMESSCSGTAVTGPLICVASSAAQISWSVCAEKGSRLRRSVAEKRKGVCAMLVKAGRRSCRPMVDRSTPSMSTRPELGSRRRKSTERRELLPAPVLPQMPTRLPASMVQLSPRSVGSRSARYRAHTSSSTMRPSDGQGAGGAAPAMRSGGSGSSLEYCRQRSTDTSWFSTSADWRTIHCRSPASCRP